MEIFILAINHNTNDPPYILYVECRRVLNFLVQIMCFVMIDDFNVWLCIFQMIRYSPKVTSAYINLSLTNHARMYIVVVGKYINVSISISPFAKGLY